LGRNTLSAFPASQVDLAVRRQIPLLERVRLQIRAEFFNIFNHPNFAPPETFWGRATFGISKSMLNQAFGFGDTGLNQRYQFGGPRSIQLAAKLQF
jgi:hypothetical protein